ncbi:MAG TPA: type II secretion system F family protein [Candidatus Paceibacterota bacterium]
MLYKYQTLNQDGKREEGTIDAVSLDVAIASLHKRGLTVSKISPVEEKKKFGLLMSLSKRVSNRDVVILSRQLATLFDAQVSALRVFKLLAGETENPILRDALTEITDDLQGGSSISKALGKHPKIFSDFYVNMVRAGEETGKLDDTFTYLADHLDRTYEVTSKARNAFIYPVFVITVFIGVMILMFTLIIPKISLILKDSGQEIPIYTKIIFMISDFFINYGVFLAALLVVGLFFLVRFLRTKEGHIAWDRSKITLPYVGNLYRKLFLSIISDNMHTMVVSGIPMLKAIEITSNVVGNAVYRDILATAAADIKGGSPLSQALSKYKEVPSILTQMVKVGEETGELGSILNTMAKFYQREVNNAVDIIVSLIEPVMIVALGLGVGILMAAVLIPIYNIASSAGF